MILVSQIYDTLLAYCRKDKRGLSFSPDDFNSAIVQVNQRIYRLDYAQFEESKLSMDETGSFKIVNYAINLDVNGVGVLPSNYFHLVGEPKYIHSTYGRRKIELITSLENDNREMDYYTKGSALYPTAYMGYSLSANDMALYVTPATCTPIYISYLRKVNTPFLDYYVNDTTLELTYMAEGATVAMPLGCTSRTGIVGPANITSQTVNMEFHDHDFPQVINLLIEAVGISLPDNDLVSISNNDLPIIEKS
jgi:hypothetical protein